MAIVTQGRLFHLVKFYSNSYLAFARTILESILGKLDQHLLCTNYRLA